MNIFEQFDLSRLAAAALLATVVTHAQAQAPCGPMPRPLPSDWSITQSSDGTTTFINTGASQYPESDTLGPNPSNLLPTEYTNACDQNGNEIPNTLASTPEHPYNLHPDPTVSPIDKTSPTDDLMIVLRHLRAVAGEKPDDRIVDDSRGRRGPPALDRALVQLGIDVLEGNPLPRSYSGLPVLHYMGPLKTKPVTLVKDADGNVIGGEVTIHQVWYDTHIESDTAYVDPTGVDNVPWTIHYVVDVLNRGHEDFAPYAMWFNGTFGMPHVGQDQTFFPMEEGLRYEYHMKMPPARFWNLSYHWGWRIHPPRVQVTENVQFKLGGRPRDAFEVDAFGANPRQDEAAKLAAIDMIGDLAPEKRMWKALRAIKGGLSGRRLESQVAEFEASFDDWQHRNRLPRGVTASPDVDETLFYVNNTIYGEVKGYVRDNQREMKAWRKRGDKVKVQLLNGDYFLHSYVLVDFGGLRGWENQFHNTMPVGGAGALFSFGRNHWWVNTTSGPVVIPAAARPAAAPGRRMGMHELHEREHDGPRYMRLDRKDRGADKVSAEGVGEHFVEVTFNYEPSPRIRMYQFDAFHHDTAVWSLH